MKRSGLALAGRSLLFAVVAGLAVIPALMVGGSLVGRFWAWMAVCLGTAVLYVVTVAPSWARALPAGALATLFSIAVAGLATTPAELALGAALVVGVCRSGLLYRRRGMRSLAIEVGLLAIGLVFARSLAGSSPLTIGLGVWGFYLVQSLFFVIAGWETQQPAGTVEDPFDEAERRAMEILHSADSG